MASSASSEDDGLRDPPADADLLQVRVRSFQHERIGSKEIEMFYSPGTRIAYFSCKCSACVEEDADGGFFRTPAVLLDHTGYAGIGEAMWACSLVIDDPRYLYYHAKTAHLWIQDGACRVISTLSTRLPRCCTHCPCMPRFSSCFR